MSGSNQSGPTQSDIRKLFALSGNRCAFPKCTSQLVEGASVVGEICHIKAVKPTGPRHDASQSAAERHGISNLILLCSIHHKVVDDDPDSYTAIRLAEIKRTHEIKVAGSDSTPSQALSNMFVGQIISADNFSSGITAQNVRADTINIQHGDGSRPKYTRTLQAVEKLWGLLIELKRELGPLSVADTILTIDEQAEIFRGGGTWQMKQSLLPFADHGRTAETFIRLGLNQSENERPFVSKRLYAIYYATQGVLIRHAFLVSLSFKKQVMQDWRKDNGIFDLVGSVLPKTLVDQLRSQDGILLMQVVGRLEEAFLSEWEQSKG